MTFQEVSYVLLLPAMLIVLGFASVRRQGIVSTPVLTRLLPGILGMAALFALVGPPGDQHRVAAALLLFCAPVLLAVVPLWIRRIRARPAVLAAAMAVGYVLRAAVAVGIGIQLDLLAM